MAERRFYQFGPFRLDAGGRLLFRGNDPVPLPPKAADTLLLLVENAGQVVEKDELLKQVWHGAFVEEGSLTRAISVLRKALGEGVDGQEYIATISKRGYRFAAPVSAVGAAPEEPAEAVATTRDRPRIFVPWLVGGLALTTLAVLAMLALSNFRSSVRRNATLPPIRSLAVLPLENLSRDPDQDYFAEGITEELTTELAQINALKVISHTSVVQYKGSRKATPQIARELGVDAVIEGAVERAGDKVAIRVQLIEGSSDRHLWAKSYDRNLRDVLELQKEVTHAIVDEIQAKLSAPEKAHLARAPAVDSHSYESYLKGQFSLERGDLQKSTAYFQQAIRESPNNALAYAGLANAYISLGQPWFGGADRRPKDVLPQAEAAAKKALEIDDSLGEAHLALARVIQLYDWNWPTVEKEYRRALALNQNDTLAHAEFGEYLQEMGRNEEALAEYRQAAALDPLNALHTANVGGVFYTARQYDDAVPELQKALRLEPDRVDAHVMLGWVYEQEKMYPEAAAELQKAIELSHRHEVPLASLGKVLGESGKKEEARAILKELQQRSAQRYVSPCLLTLVELGLGEREQALASLEQGYANRDQWMLYLKVDPHLDELRSDPRFQDLVRRIGIP